jgi:tRNA-2-methylthio-N6-dimethylallyladenosine synthase
MSGRGLPTTIHVETFGCQMNVYDTAAIYGLLAEHGFVRCEDTASSEVVLLNTCSVREHAEHRIISRVGELRRDRRLRGRPRLIGLCGCLAERAAVELVGERSGADLAVGVDQYDRLGPLLRELLGDAAADESAAETAGGPTRHASLPPAAAERIVTGHRADAHYVAPPEAYPPNNSHLVTIHKGCDYRCTYCIVPAVRGSQREKAPGVIFDEVARVVAAGGEEVTLLGQNVTAYHWRGGPGADPGELDFPALLRRVAAVPGLRRVRFLTGHPRDLTDSLIEAIADTPAVCPWLHVPAQSGSDRILRRMKRLYTRDDYLRMVERARARIPTVTFSSDFIVGFPGETDDDFRLTLELLRSVGYDQTFSFKYSERPGTPAARLPDDVPPAVKKARLAELMAAQAEIWRGVAAAQVGARWRIALEERARRPAGAWRGRTANNRKVLVTLPEGRAGLELEVRITGFRDTTFRGEPLAEAR